VRARAIARARAALATRAALAASPSPATSVLRTRWAVAAAVACAASAALGAAAYAIHARRASSSARHPAAPVVGVAVTRPPAPLAPPPIPDVHPATAHAVGAPRAAQADAIREELRLLRQARAAVGREDFAAALPPIAEHARRFKDGRLAEEREALRVKALAGLGRADEARRAAVSFRARFPHSVLLPAVSKMPASGP
jgi:hypothetical protein